MLQLRVFIFVMAILAMSPSLAMAHEIRSQRGAAAARALDIALEPVLANGVWHFKVDIAFTGDHSGSSLIELPNAWAGQSELFKAVQDLHVIGSGIVMHDTGKTHIKRLSYARDQAVHLEYELVQDSAGPAVTENRFRVLMQPEYFHWIGSAAWVLPAGPNDEHFNIHMHWNKVPADWTLANSFAVSKKDQEFEATRAQLLSSIFVGGDFRLNTVLVKGHPVHTAIRGQWKFSDAQFTALTKSIVETERQFWKADDPYFLVTMIPLSDRPGSKSVGGAGFTSSFATFNTPNIEPKDLEALLAHEYFHNWNPRKLGRMPAMERTMYWFSEGVTDYYTHLLRLRAGLLTLEAYVDQYNELLKATYMSPVRSAGEERISKDFWRDQNVQKLPYQRGALLATEWNAQIRQVSAGKLSIDNVMHDLADAAREARGSALTELTPQRLNSVLRPYTGSDALALIDKHIGQGVLIEPRENWFGPFIKLVWQDIPVWELGLDMNRLRNQKIIAAVVPGSAAYRAGLRNGQQLLRRLPILIDDTSKYVEMTVKDGDGERTIRYLPLSTSNIVRVPQFRVPASMSASEREQTLRWLGVAPVPLNTALN
jgi:predicted metalloprotease with PDZ domain